jgi:hypothetical protein
MGLFASSGGYQRGLDKQAVDLLQSTETPDIEGMKLQLEQLVQQGQISPEEAQTYLQQSSAMNNISLDPKFKQAQMDALSSLQDIGNNHGVTAADQAQLNDIQTQEDTHARGAREAILQNAQARGVGGSGAELLSQMTNQQDAATRASNRGFDVAANAQQRALAALQAAGQMGGQLQNNQFNQQAQIANANDSISRFNTANQQNQENMNVGARNAAQQANLANQQSIANQNVDMANKQQQYNKQLSQTDFENQMKKNQAVAGALNKTGANQQANQSANDQIGRQMIGMGLGAAAAFSDEKLKKDVEKFDSSAFLDNLTSYKYNYKNPKHGEGKHVGVMAQDVEKVLPQMVENTPEGKVVDYNKAGGPLFASLADIHHRLKKIEGRK